MKSRARRHGHRSAWQVVRDLSLEAVAVALFFAAMIYVGVRWNLEATAFRWPAMATATAIVFGYSVAKRRRYWRRPRFWVAWTALLAVHLVAYIELLLWDVNFGFFWFAFLTPIEWMVVYPVLDAAAGKKRQPMRAP